MVKFANSYYLQVEREEGIQFVGYQRNKTSIAREGRRRAFSSLVKQRETTSSGREGEGNKEGASSLVNKRRR